MAVLGRQLEIDACLPKFCASAATWILAGVMPVVRERRRLSPLSVSMVINSQATEELYQSSVVKGGRKFSGIGGSGQFSVNGGVGGKDAGPGSALGG